MSTTETSSKRIAPVAQLGAWGALEPDSNQADAAGRTDGRRPSTSGVGWSDDRLAIGSRGQSRDGVRQKMGSRGQSRDGARESLRSRGQSRGSKRQTHEGRSRPPSQGFPAAVDGQECPNTSWSCGGVEGKSTIATFLSPRDGLRGIISQLPVECIERGKSRGKSRESHRSGTRGWDDFGSRPHTRDGVKSTGRSSHGEIRQRRVSTIVPMTGEEEDAIAYRKPTFICFGLIPWTKKEDLPDLPQFNLFRMPIDHPVRSIAIHLSIDTRLQAFWMCLAVVHFSFSLSEIQNNLFGCVIDNSSKDHEACRYSLPAWHHLVFLFFFCLEAAIKIVGLGLTGGRFSWFTQDSFNKLDVFALLAYFYETLNAVALGGTLSLSLRGLRLIRLMQPIGQLRIFSELGTVFESLGLALMPMLTVLLFIWFILILFGIMGMSIWGKASFRRRCVWADTLEIKQPETFCKRTEFEHNYPDCTTSAISWEVIYNPRDILATPELVGTSQKCETNPVRPQDRGGTLVGLKDSLPKALSNTCGEMQLCLDVENPNYGFVSFDHLPAALITLFQVMSGDSDVNVMWYAINSEPEMSIMTRIYFVVYTFSVLHVLINVFVAVFAKIFAECREGHADDSDSRQQEDLDSIASASYCAESSAGGHSTSSGMDENHKQMSGDLNDEEARFQKQLELKRQHELLEKESEEKRNFVGSSKWLYMYFKQPINPSFQHLMLLCRDNDFYDTLCFSIVLLQSVSLSMIGQMCSDATDCSVDDLLTSIVQNSNYFFIFDAVVQIFCDGSVAKFFESGENIFNFSVTFVTTLGLILSLLGVSQDAVAALRGMAILRLLRVFKFADVLKPIWLMLIKSTGSLIPVMNLVIFNTMLLIVYFSVGRSLFAETLNDNFRYNYSTLSRGYMMLLTVLTGDSWTSIMYEGMSQFCREDVCDNFYITVTAFFYMSWYFYGQFLFITMFLAIILDSFAVEEFMTATEVGEEGDDVTKEEAIERIANFQKLPPWAVSQGLVKLAFIKMGHGDYINKEKLITFTRLVQPMTKWRVLKTLGVIRARQYLRKTFCACLADSVLVPYPGDDDYVRPDEHEKEVKELTVEEVEVLVASKFRRNIEEHMKILVQSGMLGELSVIASTMGILNHVDLKNPHMTEPFVAIKILRHPNIGKRLKVEGFYESRMEEMMTKSQQTSLVDGEAMHEDEFAGLNLSILENNRSSARDEVTIFTVFNAKMEVFRSRCLTLVNSSAYNSFMFGTILLSSIFLCFETPHDSIEGVVPRSTRQAADVFFNLCFSVEAGAKIAAWGFYKPQSFECPSYLSSVQNQADLFVLLMALAEMTGAGDYIGNSTTKVIRLMKVMRPIRLLLRSDGLRQIIEALFASLKPMFYATLFLLVMCAMFSVTGMAFFRNKFFSCNDTSLDGLLGQGRKECVGLYLSDAGYFAPRVWARPPWGNHFDSVASSVAALFRILTLNWSALYFYAQDAYHVDIQPVPGVSMALASLYFHTFLLVGSFFGLNLFASFMCDTFYSLQGTAQLEEVQWMAVKAMLKDNMPKKIRTPPKNSFSTFLREILESSAFQNFSALCLLVNVTFMGTTTSDEDSAKEDMLNLQNEIFFGVMCVEAGLRLLSLGPVIYITNRGNQFDVFLITATAATMLFEDTLRTFSQAVRILRLFKFLRALAKDKTISDVFETVRVSMGQVVNILIILVVILIMLAVLAVQLFGLTRPGMRLGIPFFEFGSEANFSTFATAAHTIFQLMFGEDFPTLWNDCQIEPPECSLDIYNDKGQLIAPSDCPSYKWNATWFFPMVLVLTNYVMLNLFVGMIMNNFTYISNKDGNGVIENEHFVDAAFKYVFHFDPKLKGQIPIEKVYQFYNMVGAPLGNHGTTKNVGRYLCIRQELQQNMLDESERQFSWWYNKVYLPACDREEAEIEAHLKDYKQAKNDALKAEHEYRAAVGDDEKALLEVGLDILPDTSDDEDGDEKVTREDEEESVVDAPAIRMEAKIMEEDTCEQDATTVSGGNMGQPKAQPQGKVKKIKTNKVQKTMSAIERQMENINVGGSIQNTYTDKEIRELKMAFLSARKDAAVQPEDTFKIKLLRYFKNKERNIVPQKSMEERKDKDNIIKYEVAFQMISAVCRGGIERRRRRMARQMAQERLRAGRKVLQGVKMRSMKEDDNMRRQQLRGIQDEFAKNSYDDLATESELGPLKLACCKMAKYGLIQGHKLADIAEELGIKVGECGIYELEEDELERVRMLSSQFQELQAHVQTIESIKELLSKGGEIAASYLHLAARKYKINLGDGFELITRSSGTDLSKIIHDASVRSIILELTPWILDRKAGVHLKISDSPTEAAARSPNAPGGPGTVADKDEQERHMDKIEMDDALRIELEQLKEQYEKHQQYNQELNIIVETTNVKTRSLEKSLTMQRAKHESLQKMTPALTNVMEHMPFERAHRQMKKGILIHDPTRGTSLYSPMHADASITTAVESGPPHTTAQFELPVKAHDDADNLARDNDISDDSLLGESLNSSLSGKGERVGGQDDVSKLQTSLEIARAEQARLERLLNKAKREATNRKQSNSTEDPKAQSEREEKIAAARARRAMKDDIPVDSESATSGLLSPRDKALRADVKKKEKVKQEKAKQTAENERKSPVKGDAGGA